jgi:hypothetical protein
MVQQNQKSVNFHITMYFPERHVKCVSKVYTVQDRKYTVGISIKEAPLYN